MIKNHHCHTWILFLFQINVISSLTDLYPLPNTNNELRSTSSSRSVSGWQSHCDTPDEWFSDYSLDNSKQIWPEGRIAYELHPNLTKPNLIDIFTVFDDFHEKTCIRFEHRYDPSIQTSYLSIEPSNDVQCATSSFCFKNTYQFVRINPSCFSTAIVTHQLGHALCMPHEHQRNDRDEYLDYSQCTVKPVPPKLTFHRFEGFPYDYHSQMHYQCGECNGGMPKTVEVTRCGMDARTDLSILDADKINQLYNCQGCFRHRWLSTENLTEFDKLTMIPFGYSPRNNQLLYICRASFRGEVAAGSYRLDENLCYIAFQFEVVMVKENVQVFTLPPPESTVEAIMMRHSTYKLVPHYDLSEDDRIIPVGETLYGSTSYVAVATIGDHREYRETLIGSVSTNSENYAHIPYQNRKIVVKDFDVLTCSSNR